MLCKIYQIGSDFVLLFSNLYCRTTRLGQIGKGFCINDTGELGEECRAGRDMQLYVEVDGKKR